MSEGRVNRDEAHDSRGSNISRNCSAVQALFKSTTISRKLSRINGAGGRCMSTAGRKFGRVAFSRPTCYCNCHSGTGSFKPDVLAEADKFEYSNNMSAFRDLWRYLHALLINSYDVFFQVSDLHEAGSPALMSVVVPTVIQVSTYT